MLSNGNSCARAKKHTTELNFARNGHKNLNHPDHKDLSVDLAHLQLALGFRIASPDVSSWHVCDMSADPDNVRGWGKTGGERQAVKAALLNPKAK